jgi:cell division inhibitor SepF
MPGIKERFYNFVGLEEVEEDEELMEQDGGIGGSHPGSPVEWQEEVTRQRRRGGLVSLPSSHKGFRVVVMHPRTLEDGQAIADQVKARRPVIVNLDLADDRSQQRLLNFLSGVAYAVDGGLRQVGDNIYLVTPSNVEVDSVEREDDGPSQWVRSGIK